MELKFTDMRTNPYERGRVSAMRNPLFNEKDWRTSISNDTVDAYLSLMQNTKNIDVNEFYKKYNLYFGDSNTRLTALYNEFVADKTNKKVRYLKQFDDNGQLLTTVNEAGDVIPLYNEVEMSDYEYNKYVIAETNKLYSEEQVNSLIEKSRTNGNNFLKFLGDIGSLTGHFANEVSSILDTGAAAFKGILDATSAPTFSEIDDYFMESYSQFKDAGLKSQVDGMLAEFDYNYTHFVDENGEYTNVANDLIGIASTLGQMVGATIVSAGTGFNPTATFYIGNVFAPEVAENYRQINKDSSLTSLETLQILGKAGTTTALQYGAELLLGKFLGTSAFDEVFWGRNLGKQVNPFTKASSFTKRGIYNAIKSSVQEGFEEGLQETTDFLVNKGFHLFINENFNDVDWSWEDIGHAMLLGALVSVIGTSASILGTKRITNGEISYDETGTLIKDKDGKPKFNKLNKIASWQYGLDMRSMSEAYDSVLKIADEIENNNYEISDETASEYKAAYYQATVAFKTVAGIFGEIGETKFNKANDILGVITENINNGKFTENFNSKEKLNDSLKAIDFKFDELFKSVLLNNGTTTLSEKITKDSLSMDRDGAEKLKELFEMGFETIVTAEDGDKMSSTEDGKITVMPEKELNNLSPDEIVLNDVDRRIINYLSENLTEQIIKLGKDYCGNDVNNEDIACRLMTDYNFFSSILLTGNKDCYELLSNALIFKKGLSDKTIKDKVEKKRVDEIIVLWCNSLSEYCKIHVEADLEWIDFLDSDLQAKYKADIRKERIGAELYNKAVTKTLSNNEIDFLTKRINNLPLSQSIKTKLINQLQSGDIIAREKAIKRILSYYSDLYYANYDGVKYMPDNSIANRAFNSFLKSMNLYCENILSEDKLSESEKQIILSKYGSLNQDSILQFRNEQLKNYNGYSFKIINDKVQIYKGDAAVGFAHFNSLIHLSELDDLNRGLPIKTFKRNSILSKMINKDVGGLARIGITVDEVIKNPALLSATTQNNILKFAKENYNIVRNKADSEITYLYLRDYFLTKHGLGLTTRTNGEFVFVKYETMSKLIKADIITDRMSLEDIVSPEIIPYGCKIKFIDTSEYNSELAYYLAVTNHPLENSVKLYDNTLYVSKSILANQNNAKFTILHELIHSKQWENNLAAGMSYNWQTTISVKKLNEILSNVEKHAPQLFTGLSTKDSKLKRLRDVIYFGSNEIQANGLEASKIYDYVPIVVKTGIDETIVTFSWGYSFKLGDENSYVNSLEFLKNNISLNKHFSQFYQNILNSDKFTPDQINKLTKVLTEPVRSGEDILMANYKDKLVRLKNYFKNNKVIAEAGFRYMYYLYGAGKSYSEFLNSNIPCIVGSEYDKKSGLRIAYLGNDIISHIYQNEENAELKWSLVPVKNIIGYFVNGERILIENPKLFKLSDLQFKQNRINNKSLVNNLVNSDEFLKDFLTISGPGIELGPKDIRKITDKELSLKLELNSNKYSVSKHINMYKIAGFRTMFNSSNQEYNSELKQNILDTITPEYRSLSFQYANELFAKNMSFKEFLDVDVPFMRIQKGEKIVNEQFVSTCGFGNVDNLINLLNLANEPNSDVDTLIVGTFKVRDSLSYISNTHNEFIVKPEFINVDKTYNFQKDASTGKLVFNIDGAIINDETQINSLPILPIGAQERIKSGTFVSIEEDPSMEPGPESKHHKYSKRTLIGRTYFKDGKYRNEYKYEWPETVNRQVSKQKSKDTPLQIFYDIAESQGKRLQMPKRLQNLILKTSDIKLDKELQDMIDDGTITDRDVIDYITLNEDISDETFKVIKDIYFPDSPINSRLELDNYALLYAPKYYALGMALRVIDDKFGTDFYKRDIKPEQLDDYINKVAQVDKQLYNDIQRVIRDYSSYKGSGVTMPERYMNLRWLDSFTGTLSEAHDIATNVKSLAIYKSKGFSLDSKLGSSKNSRSRGEIIADAANAFTMIDNMSYKELQTVVKALYLEQNQTLVKNGEMSIRELSQEFNETFGNIPYDELLDFYNELAEELPNSVVLKQVITTNAESNGFDENQINVLTSEGVTKLLKQKYNSVSRINGLLKTIKKNIAPKMYKYILNDYSDILNADLSLKESAYKKSDGRANDYDKLEEIFIRVRELSKFVKAGAFNNKNNLEIFNANKKRIAKAVDNAVKEKENVTPKTTITYIVDNEVREFTINDKVPSVIQSLLKTQLSKYSKTKVQLLSKENEVHLTRTMSEFIDQNAEVLNNLSQQDVDEIIDFYLNNAPFISGTSESVYNTVQVLSTAYILRMTDMGIFKLSNDKRLDLEKFLENRISAYATGLSVWKNAIKYIKPDDQTKEAMMRHVGIELDAEELTYVHEMNVAIRQGNVAKAQEYKSKLYEHVMVRNPKTKKSVLSKILRYEQNAMLSGPGTWIRNVISNVGVTTLNKASDLIGRTLVGKKSVKGQYKLDKAVSDKTTEFIKVNIKDSGLLELIRDNNLKYSLHSNAGVVGNTIEDLIQSSLMKEFGQNDKFTRFIRKMISDDKYVDKRFEWYLGRMLEEDNVDLSSGLSQKVLDTVANAYVQAAKEFMHTDNAIYQFERFIRSKGEVWYFAYKQLAPFMGTSWNWFIEGINYTPIGLLNSIVKLAKLESTIEKAEAMEREGKNVNSKFTEYTLKRNFGKGIIGTVGCIIGCLLAGFGFAKIDEDDDEYKLVVGDYSVDISDLYGTQGILLGLTAVGGIKNQDKISDILNSTLNQLLRDSAFESVTNAFRGSDTPSDVAENSLYSIANMFVPNLLKTVSKIVRKYNVVYDKGFLGSVERLASSIPFSDRFFANKVDIYTGEKQLTSKVPLLFNTVNALSPVDITAANISKNELIAISHGVKSSQLSGSYTVNEQKVTLSAEEIEKVNVWCGKLNKDVLTKFLNNKISKSVKMSNGKYKELRYSQMDDKQKKAAIDNIMSNNSSLSKIYILTSTGKYKYYASDSEYEELRKLGITKNVYKKTNKQSGFIKIN